MRTRISITTCSPQDLNIGDVIPLSENLSIALLLKNDGKHWFSRPAELPAVALRFMSGSPFLWDQKASVFRSISTDVVVHIDAAEIGVFRGFAKEIAGIFSEISDAGGVEPISSEQIRTFSVENQRLAISLSAMILNGNLDDLPHHIRLVFEAMRNLSQDAQAVLLSSLFFELLADRLETALQDKDERIAALASEVDRLQQQAMIAELESYADRVGAIHFW